MEKKKEFVETGTVERIVAAMILYKAEPFYKYIRISSGDR